MRFALTGAAGYVAPKHMQAIKECGGELVAILDPHDSVGVIDSYFPNAEFFTDAERLDRHLYRLKQKGIPIDYLSICSPNYLHDAHCRMGLRNNAHVICEKPLGMTPANIEMLQEMEKETGKNIYTILQLRLHPSIIALKQKIDAAPEGVKYLVDLTYITSRGNWYLRSWKGMYGKSGGIALNIGIHFFDMLIWLFGSVVHSKVFWKYDDYMCGKLNLKKAEVMWELSTDGNRLPDKVKEIGQSAYRSIQIDGEEIEFTSGFTDLHKQSYQRIIDGHGFRAVEAIPSIELVHNMMECN